MEELQKLYDVLVRDGYYTNSFEDFQVKYENSEYREQVFNVVSRDGLYTKSREDFDIKYPVKKKVVSEQPSTELAPTPLVQKEEAMVSESPTPDGESVVTETEVVEEQPAPVDPYTDITPEMISQDEEVTVPKLNEMYGQDFEFEQAGAGYDAVLVKSKKTGDKKIFTLDAFTDAGDVESAQEIKDFMEFNMRKTQTELEKGFEVEDTAILAEVESISAEYDSISKEAEGLKALVRSGIITDVENDPRVLAFQKKEDDVMSRFNDAVTKRQDLYTEFEKDFQEAPMVEKKYFEGNDIVMMPNMAMGGKMVPTPVTKSDIGKALSFLDDFTENYRLIPDLGDFIDGMGGALAQADKQGTMANLGNQILTRAKNMSKEDFQSLIDAEEAMKNLPRSREAQQYDRDYDEVLEEGGNHITAWLTSMAKNPQAAAEIAVSSFGAMMNKSSLAAAATVEGAAATAGLAGGPLAEVTVPVAMAAAIPYAMAAAGIAVETGVSTSEGIRDYFDEENKKRAALGEDPLEYTPEAIEDIVNNPDAMSKIRNKALARGATIGVIDALTSKIGMRGGKYVFRKAGSRGIQTLATIPIEMSGAMVGEALAQRITDGKVDMKEVTAEAMGEAPSTAVTVASTMVTPTKGTYKINNEFNTKEELMDVLKTATNDELSSMNIQITDDVEVSDLQRKRARGAKIEKNIPVEIQGEAREEAVRLEEERMAIKETTDGPKSVAVERKLADIDEKLDRIYSGESVTTEEAVVEEAPVYEVPTVVSTPTPEKYAIVNRNDGKGNITLTEAEYNAEMEMFAPAEEVVVEEAAPDKIKKLDELSDRRKALLKETGLGRSVLRDVKSLLNDRRPIKEMLANAFPDRKIVDNKIWDEVDNVGDEIRDLQNEIIDDNITTEEGNKIQEIRERLRPIDNEIRVLEDGETVSKSDKKRIKKLDSEWYSIYNEIKAIENDVVERYRKQELETKTEQDAIQEPSTETVDVQEPATDGGPMGKGDITGEVTEAVEAEVETPAAEGEAEGQPLTEQEAFDEFNAMLDGKKTRMRKGGEEVAVEDYVDVEAVTEEMNQLDPLFVEYTTPSLSEEIEVSPISEATDTSPIPQEVLDFYGVKDATEFEKSIEEFEGIPMVRGGMTDMLGGGKIKDSMGKDMEIGGGCMFSLRNIANKGLAWAGIDKSGAETQYKDAVNLYNDNKALFKRLWKAGRLPNGHVPMTITKMGDTGVNSNEAVFRYVLPKVKSVPLANREKSFDALVERMFSERTKKDGTILPPLISETEVEEGKENKITRAEKIQKLIKENNVTTMDGFLEAIIKDANLRAKDEKKAILALDDRSKIFDVMFSKGAKGGPRARGNTNTHSKALFEGIENDPFLLNAENVYDAIAEKSIKDTPKGYVVAIVGIDVLNGGVAKASHSNYGFGPKGRAIALITNPRHQVDIFPEQAARAAGQAKIKESKGKSEMESDKNILGRALSPYFNMLPAQGQKARVQPDTTEQLIGLMRLTFPSVQAYTSQAEFDNIIQQEDVREHIVDGVPVLGLTKDGKVYINPAKSSVNTPIHEFGHIWTDMLRATDDGKKLLAKGLSFVDSDPKAYDEAKRKYAEYDADGNITNEELVREEALVAMIAAKGEGIVDAAQRSKFKTWLKALMEYVKKNFKGTFESVGTGTDKKVKSLIDSKMIKGLTLDQFLDMAIADLFSGEIAFTQPKKSTTPQESRAKMKKDGKLLAPNGKPSNLTPEQYELVRTPAFKKWFGDWENDPKNASKVVDENGEPKVVYHGTGATFDVFEGHSFFTDDWYNADGYAGGENIYEVFLNTKNPLVVDAKGKKWDELDEPYGSTQGVVGELDTKKYDGVVFNNIKDSWIDDADYQDAGVVYSIPVSNQIKLADGSNKTFDADSPNIRFSKAGIDVSQNTLFENVQLGRDAGIADSVIKEVLKSRGFKVADITKAMEIEVDALKMLPEAFRAIGAAQGLQLFNRVEDGLRKFTAPPKTKAETKASKVKRANELKKNNPELKNLTVEQVIAKYPKDVKEFVEKTSAEIREKAIELLINDPAFKEQSESAQEKMISAYDKSLGITANKNVQKFVQSIRQTIRDRKKGMQDVKAAQNEFRKLMSSLPKDVKASPQVKKLVSIVSGITEDNIIPSMEKAMDVVNEIKVKEESAKQVQQALRDKISSIREDARYLKDLRTQLVKFVRESLPMSSIYNKSQLSRVASIVSNLNMKNYEAQSQKIVELIEKQLDRMRNAEVRKALKVAKKNVNTKLGIASGLRINLEKMLAINPSLIPDSVFDKYESVVKMIGQKKSVLKLAEISETTEMVNEIMTAVDTELSKVPELKQRFDAYEDKVFTKDGKLNYAATIQAMLKEELITTEEAAIMKRYKSDINVQEKNEGKTEEEIQEERDALFDELNDVSVDSARLPSRNERKLAKRLGELVNTDAVESFDNLGLAQLIGVIDNINNGYLPHAAEVMVEKMEAANRSKSLSSAISQISPAAFSKAYATIKAKLTPKEKNAFYKLLERSPLFFIDQVFGDFKSKRIYNSLFKPVAEAFTSFETDTKRVREALEKAEKSLAKSFNMDSNKTLASKYKIMSYLLQLEFESNPDSKNVAPAKAFLDKTINHLPKDIYKGEISVLKSIKEKFADADGEISLEKLEDSLTPAEKAAVKAIQEVNTSLVDEAVFTAAVIRGDAIQPLTNYIHRNVIGKSNMSEDTGASISQEFSKNRQPSTKAQSLLERIEGASPISFDPFSSTQRGAKMTLMDYHMTEAVRTGRKTLNATEKSLTEGGKEMNEDQLMAFEAIKRGFNQTLEDTFNQNFSNTTLADEAFNWIKKTGYRAILADVPRMFAELLSNLGFVALSHPKAFAAGVKLKNIVMSPSAVNIMTNVGSSQTSRIYAGGLSGKMVDTNLLTDSGVKAGEVKGDVMNKLSQISELSVGKYKRGVEFIADTMISSPDKAVMRPAWFGAFNQEFKAVAGVEPNYDLIAKNDEAYMNKFEDAISKAKDKADETSTLIGAADNPFSGILKGKVRPQDSGLTVFFKNFNSFMTRFLIYEYTAAKTGVNAAVGNGTMSKQEGAQLVAAVTTRMIAYSILTKMFSEMMVEAVTGIEDDDEETAMQKIGQGVVSGLVGLVLGRDFGNVTKAIINQGAEMFNEKYLSALRDGEYNQYEDAIAFTMLPPQKDYKDSELPELIRNIIGPLGPAYKAAELVYKQARAKEKKTEEARERQRRARQERIPLEVLGNLGLIPFYKDIRKILLKDMYKDLRKEDKKEEEEEDTGRGRKRESTRRGRKRKESTRRGRKRD